MHVVERLKSLTNVELPMEALFQQCQDLNTASPTLVCMYEKSKIPFLLHALCLFCKRAYRGTKPEESFG